MIPEIGQFALVLALCLAFTGAVMGVAGSVRGNVAWMGVARPGRSGAARFRGHRLRLPYVCFRHQRLSVSASTLRIRTPGLPLPYRVAGVWGGHEGSLLLWMLMLTLWSSAVAAFSRQLPDDMVACVLGVMSMVSVGFLAFMLFTSNRSIGCCLPRRMAKT